MVWAPRSMLRLVAESTKWCHAESGSWPERRSTSWPSASRPAFSSMVGQTRLLLTPSRSSITGRRARKSMNVSGSNAAMVRAPHSSSSVDIASCAAPPASIQPVSMTTSTGSTSSGSSWRS